MHKGDVHNLQNVEAFYRVDNTHSLTNQTVFFRTRHTGVVFEDTKPLASNDKIWSGTVIGYRTGQSGNANGFLVQIKASLTLQFRTYSQIEKEFLFIPQTQCINDTCPDTFIFVPQSRLIKPTDFSDLLQRIDPQHQSKVLWKALELQTGLTASPKRVVMATQTPREDLVFNSGQISADTIQALSQVIQQAQHDEASQKIEKLISGQTVELKQLPTGPYVQAYFEPNGTVYRYYHGGIGVDNPRSGLWHQGAWKVKRVNCVSGCMIIHA